MHDLQLSFEPKELEELNNLLERAFRSGEFEQIYGSLEETIRSLEDTKSQKAFIAKLAFEEGRCTTDLECLTLQRLSSIKTGVSLRGFFNPLSGVRYPELPDQKTEHVFINPVSLDTTSQDIIVDADFGQYVFICWMSLTVGSLSQAISVVLNHCKSRKQFDREIGSFQLVQENIVKNFLNFLKFRASLIYSLNEVGNSLDLIKISLKNYLGNFRDTSDLLIQCCGGIGFTEEFGLSVFFRRFLRLLDIIDFE